MGMLSRFRETLWFKRGILDAAPPPREDAAGTDDMSGAHLPIEDRYLDDGTVSSEDSLAFSVRTGTTQHVPTGSHGHDPTAPAFEAKALVRQLKGGRHTVAVAAVAAAVAVVALVVAML